MAITQNHVINIQPGVSAPLVIHCSQGDTGTQINLTVVNGDEEFDCSSYVCSVHGVRSDGANWGPFPVTVSGSTVSFPLRSAMTAIAGPCLAEISVGTVGTANFAILVENATFGVGVTYTEDASVYQNILNYVMGATQNIKTEATATVNKALDQMNTKANDLQNQYAVTNAKLDTAISAATQDSEVQDIRVKADGTSAATAGNAVREQITELKNDLVPFPAGANSKYGTSGQLLRTLGSGETEWVDQGLPTDSQTAEAVSNWLDAHPEATTTVQDHSLTYTKLVNGTLGFVTPQMYGAKGDGVADDTDAIKDALEINKQIFFPKGTYNVAFENDTDAKPVLFSLRSDAVLLFEEGAVINVLGSSFASLSAVFGFTEFPTKNVVIDGATITCESLHSTNPMGIRCETAYDAAAEQITNLTITNCTFKNLDSAVYIVQRNTSGVSTRQTKNVLISNCKAFSCLSSFVTADGENITIKNCIADGQGNAGAYDAVSVHSGINIKILNNVFKGYTIGQVINIRNSPENKCGTRDVLISGNSIVDCPTTAIQISVTSGETAYGTTNVSVIGNRVYNCETGITISPGSATSGTPFKNFVVSGNIFESCNTSANLRANTTVWNERMTISSNIFNNSGNFAMNAVRHCTFVGNYINLKTDGTFTANNFYYSDFSGNIVWADNTEISFNTVVYAGIFSNFFKGVVKLASFSNADFFGNTCMNLLTINGAAGFSVKTDYRHGQIITYASNRPTGSTVTFNKGDMFINSDLSTDVYAWVCTASGSPGTWKAISLA